MRLILLLSMLLAAPALADLRGHGGPVRALSVSPDGESALSGSFDSTAILWRLDDGRAVEVLRAHDSSVNAVLALPDGRLATGGEDGRIAFWRPGDAAPERIETAHAAAVASLALSPDGGALASAGWDGVVRLTPLAGGPARTLEGHRGPVNAVAYLADGRLASVGHDLTLRIWPADGGPATTLSTPAPMNALLPAPEGGLLVAGADGVVRAFGSDLAPLAEIATGLAPMTGLALSPDGRTLAAGSIGGVVAIIDRATAEPVATLAAGGPVWTVAFTPDGRTLLTGGADGLVRRWDARTGDPFAGVGALAAADPLAELDGSRGARVFRACAACHTLTPDDGRRAGPTLHGVFGRRIGTAEGYVYSQALTEMDIVWTAETISALFEIGPAAYTPGTKMPEQRISDPEDRAALIAFLKEATGAR